MRNMLFVLFAGIIFWGCQKNDDGTVTVVPLPPIDLTATVISTTQVNLLWTDKSTNEDGFKIQRKTGSGNFTDIGSVGKDVINYSDNGLTPATTYTYRVYGYNNVGPSLTYRNEVTVTTNANVVLPTLTTSVISNITQASATGGGAITNDGGSPITARGIVWSTSSSPTVALTTKTSDGAGVGTYTSSLTGLTANTTYYVRAYATNTSGTGYGNVISFTSSNTGGSTGSIFNPNLTYGNVTDVDGNTYKTIQIGSQIWMAENLRTTKYRNGIIIENITDNIQWLNNSKGAWNYYNNDANNDIPYGKLYNGFAVFNSNQICPTGWHVPTDAEWNVLVANLDPSYNPTVINGTQSTSAGGKMKSTGTQYWTSPNTGATNESGFSGLPGGVRAYDGPFYEKGDSGEWWSSTEISSTSTVWYRILVYNNRDIYRASDSKKSARSVRCIKD
jgi:uncharacterized protein (TIGR02145 family)